jgi:iron only hydrogenase large subunit-like protein
LPLKKDEAENSVVDAVLTFDELSHLFDEAGIIPGMRAGFRRGKPRSPVPTVGGILKTMDIPDTGYTCLTVDGTESCRGRAGRHRGGQHTPLFSRNVRLRGQLHRRTCHGKIQKLARAALSGCRSLCRKGGFFHS